MMKKTISIHIKGFPFIIEEIAFSRLENYLNRLKSALGDQEGADEIIEDIEIRIAELLNVKTTQYKQVISDEDVIDVLNTLGDPKEYAENDDPDHAEQTSYSSESSKDHTERRLYRDTENGYVGGVCSGLAGYFNIDPTIIRLIWIGSMLIGGVGFFLYVILWIIIPKASSSIDRLKMKGKPINVDTVKEEVERAAQNVSEKSRHFANQLKKDERIKSGVSKIKAIVRSIVGFFLLFIGLSSLAVLLVFAFGSPQIIPASTENGFLSVSALSNLFFNNQIDNQMAWMSFYICSISFVVFFLLGGFVTLFNLKNKWYRYVNFTLILSGIIGFILVLIVLSRTGRDFAISQEITADIATTNGNSFTILTKTGEQLKGSDYKVKDKSGMWSFYIGKERISKYGIPIAYHFSKDTVYRVELVKSANAYTPEGAVNRARNIDYNYEFKNDTLILPPSFSYPKSDRIRNQELILHIYIPRGKSVTIDEEVIDLERKIVDDDDHDNKQYGRIRPNGTYDHIN